jgi:hypothetical protein
MGNGVIQSLWIGSGFSNNELLCMRSFLHHGQAFHLYVYEPIPGIPEGVGIRDANEIIPAARLFLDSRDSHGSFADWFRLKLLFERGGWWVDLDVVCLRPFDEPHDHCFSSETHYNQKDTELNNTCVKAPAGSPFLGEMLAQAELRLSDGSVVEWGAIGIGLFRDCMSRHGEMARFVQPPDVFCPLPYYNLSSLICQNQYVPAGHTKAIHLWNEVWRHGSLDKNAIYHPDSIYERLKKVYLPNIT